MSTENTGKTAFYKRWWFWLIVIVVVIVAVGKGSGNGGTGAASGGAASTPIILPPLETRFVEIVSTAQSESRKAENDMQRGGIKAKRDQALCEAMATPAVTDWIGTVTKIDSNSDGKGVLQISIAPDILVKTWNNALSDIGSKTLLEPGSPVFVSASAMKSGQRVVFSGDFTRGSQGDCLGEGSMSLRGKIEDPEFILRFSKISAYDSTQQPKVAAIDKPSEAPPTPKPSEQPITAPAPVAEQQPVPTTSPSTEKAQILPQATWKPSFDCSKASTFSEKAICSDPLLGKLDGALSENYKSMLASNIGEGARSDLKTTQRKWLTERNKCTSNQCLTDAYRKRVDEVCDQTVISGVIGSCTNSDDIK